MAGIGSNGTRLQGSHTQVRNPLHDKSVTNLMQAGMHVEGQMGMLRFHIQWLAGLIPCVSSVSCARTLPCMLCPMQAILMVAEQCLQLTSHTSQVFPSARAVPCMLCPLQAILIAAEKFDFSKGTRFPTLAAWYVRAACVRHLQQHSIMHVPKAVQDLVRRVQSAVKSFREDNDGRTPSQKQIAELTGLSMADVRRLAPLPTSCSTPFSSPMLAFYAEICKQQSI